MNIPRRRLRTKKVAIPLCRDPFINTLLMPVGHRPGEPERFWISTWNSVSGCTGALVDETGAYRLYHFDDPLHPGFYSVAAQDHDTLWLWGSLTEVVRLSLRTGRYESYPTGSPDGLVFHGMAYDHASGKLLAVANTYQGHGPTAIAVSFDTRRQEVARIYHEVAPDYCLHGHFPNGDGTYTVITEIPGTSLLHWDPQSETICAERLRDDFNAHSEMAKGSYYRLVQDGTTGNVYFPRRGWYDPLRRRFLKDGPVPSREMTWFADRKDTIVGAACSGGETVIGLWDKGSGEVREVARCTDSGVLNVNVTAGGALLCVSIYGQFARNELSTGRLEISRMLPAVGVQHTDCLRLIDRDRLLGTPFITQRFWEVNLKNGQGSDCGRAAPGSGEILQTWRLGDKIYMAEYAGGRLVEYDPKVHPHFPENPRVVANPPASNRPIAAADDGRYLYYACSAPYGRLGSTVTRYDTVTGANITAVNPIPNQRIVSLAYDRRGKRLLAAAHFDADCRSCTPVDDVCRIAALSAEDLFVITQFAAPAGTSYINIIGPGRRGQWLCRLLGSFPVRGNVVSDILLEIGGDPLSPASLDSAWPVPPGWLATYSTAVSPLYAVQVGGRIELWDLVRHVMVEVLYTRAANRRLMIDGGTIFLLGNRDVLVLHDALPQRELGSARA